MDNYISICCGPGCKKYVNEVLPSMILDDLHISEPPLTELIESVRICIENMDKTNAIQNGFKIHVGRLDDNSIVERVSYNFPERSSIYLIDNRFHFE